MYVRPWMFVFPFGQSLCPLSNYSYNHNFLLLYWYLTMSSHSVPIYTNVFAKATCYPNCCCYSCEDIDPFCPPTAWPFTQTRLQKQLVILIVVVIIMKTLTPSAHQRCAHLHKHVNKQLVILIVVVIFIKTLTPSANPQCAHLHKHVYKNNLLFSLL